MEVNLKRIEKIRQQNWYTNVSCGFTGKIRELTMYRTSIVSFWPDFWRSVQNEGAILKMMIQSPAI